MRNALTALVIELDVTHLDVFDERVRLGLEPTRLTRERLALAEQ